MLRTMRWPPAWRASRRGRQIPGVRAPSGGSSRDAVAGDARFTGTRSVRSEVACPPCVCRGAMCRTRVGRDPGRQSWRARVAYPAPGASARGEAASGWRISGPACSNADGAREAFTELRARFASHVQSSTRYPDSRGLPLISLAGRCWSKPSSADYHRVLPCGTLRPFCGRFRRANAAAYHRVLPRDRVIGVHSESISGAMPLDTAASFESSWVHQHRHCHSVRPVQ
jgi:hypothetical protein